MTTFSNSATYTFNLGLLPVTKVTNTVTAVSATDDLELVKSETYDVLLPDSIEGYSFSGQNNTGINATLFTLIDILPAGLAYVNGSFKVDNVPTTPTSVVGQTLTHIFGAWANGDTHTFSFQCSRV